MKNDCTLELYDLIRNMESPIKKKSNLTWREAYQHLSQNSFHFITDLGNKDQC